MDFMISPSIFHTFPHCSGYSLCFVVSRMSCRLCLEPGDEATGRALLSPCACRGSLAHVHADCLLEWCDHSKDYKRCSVCHQCPGGASDCNDGTSCCLRVFLCYQICFFLGVFLSFSMFSLLSIPPLLFFSPFLLLSCFLLVLLSSFFQSSSPTHRV